MSTSQAACCPAWAAVQVFAFWPQEKDLEEAWAAILSSTGDLPRSLPRLLCLCLDETASATAVHLFQSLVQ